MTISRASKSTTRTSDTLNTLGGQSINNLAAGSAALTVKGASGQSAALLRLQDSANATISTLGVDGVLETNTSSNRHPLVGNQFSNDGNGSAILLRKSRSATLGTNTIVQDNDNIGGIIFRGANGSGYTSAAQITVDVDGTPGASNDMPGRIVFATTADGSGSLTERMRITQNGNVGIGTSPTDGILHTLTSSTTGRAFAPENTNASFAENLTIFLVNRTANTAFSYLACYNRTDVDTEFILRGDGNAFADGTWTGGGADYAEYFEWADGNPNNQDRRGFSVTLENEKIKPAQAGDQIIGVISGNPSVVGDAAWNKWSGKYLRDDFGSYITEEYDVLQWTDEENNERAVDADGPDADQAPDDATVVVQQRRKLNPDYDPEVEYVSREDRTEWATVGLMGKLRVRKGQPVDSRWIKMRDVSADVEEWLVR